MKKTGAELIVFALEQLGVHHTFGIPGTHTTELYDELNNSKKITPVPVTHEGGASFMADAVSRTSDSIGTITIVPAAGLTHALSGIGEAFVDGIPMLIIAGGTRKDTGKHYQLHQFDQTGLASKITKAAFSIDKHEKIIETLYNAYRIANEGEPGPVFIEVPVEIMMFKGEAGEMPVFKKNSPVKKPDPEAVKKAAGMLRKARFPMMHLGWGAVDAFDLSVQLAEMLEMPVSTTLQGKSAFPNSHPLFTSVGLGKSSKPSAQWVLREHDVLLVVGARFGEVATGSYGLDQPENLIHVDINPEVFDKNYHSELKVESDAAAFLQALLDELKASPPQITSRQNGVRKKIAALNEKYHREWALNTAKNKVSPYRFFSTLREKASDDAFMVLDDGKHTFLASELFPVDKPRHFISPTDFNCMGYCVPAAIGVKLSNPGKQVMAVIGDGAFLMTGMETVTAVQNELGIVFFVFNDGELGQISQFQKAPLNRKTASVLPPFDYEAFAKATGLEFIRISKNEELEFGIGKAITLQSVGKPVLVEVVIDYSKKTMLTKGVLKVNLARFSLNEKLRFIGRAVKRKITG